MEKCRLFSGSPEQMEVMEKCRLFSGSPEQMGTTCRIRAKIKRLAQNFGLVDLNDDRLQLLFNHIFNFDIYTLFILILGVRE